MEDMISRKAAIEIASGFCHPANIAKELAKLPSAQPDMSEYSDKLWKAAYERGKAEVQQRWIPCNERLPEDGQDVLVTYKTTGKIHPCQYHDDGSRNPWYSYIDQCRAYMNVVLAWMPLPEPYAERRTDG